MGLICRAIGGLFSVLVLCVGCLIGGFCGALYCAYSLWVDEVVYGGCVGFIVVK